MWLKSITNAGEGLDLIRIHPCVVKGSVYAPPSKSYTHRAVALATLSSDATDVINPLLAEDTLASIEASKKLGCVVEDNHEEGRITIVSRSPLKCPDDVIDVRNSGTTLRLYTSISALTEGGYTVLTGDDSIRRRPMKPLLDALTKLGVEAWATRLNGLAPIIVKGGGFEGGETTIDGSISSQFISSILVAGQKAEKEITLSVDNEPVSRKYIDATIEVIKLFGGKVEKTPDYRLYVTTPSELMLKSFKVPGDFSSAAFLVAAAYLTGGDVEIRNIATNLPQADATILDIASSMGAEITVLENSIKVRGVDKRGDLTFSLRDCPDLVPVVSIMAALTPGEVEITEVAHARYKESDRINNIANELRKLGIDVKTKEDGLVIHGKNEIEGGITVETYGDHRIAMAFTILGLACRNGLTVKEIESAKVSYPGFIADLKRLGAELA